MDAATSRLGQYIKAKGFTISAISKGTNIPYFVLYDSLSNKKRLRNLRATEFLAVCSFIGQDPYKFADKKKFEKLLAANDICSDE